MQYTIYENKYNYFFVQRCASAVCCVLSFTHFCEVCYKKLTRRCTVCCVWFAFVRPK